MNLSIKPTNEIHSNITTHQELALPVPYIAASCQAIKARNQTTQVFILKKNSTQDARFLRLR